MALPSNYSQSMKKTYYDDELLERQKTTAFWDIEPCSLVKSTDVSEVPTAAIVRAKHLWNIGQLLRDYMVQNPRNVIFTLTAVRTRNFTP